LVRFWLRVDRIPRSTCSSCAAAAKGQKKSEMFL
jgi:hypothetical protein